MIANHMPYASLSKDSFELMFDNVLMVKNLLLALKHNPVSEVIFASSIDVYGSNDSIINEKTFLDPLTNYATSKAACELLLKTRLTQLSIPFLNFRLPQIIGKDDPSSKVVNKFLDAAVNKTSIIMKGDGSSSRDFASVSDVAEIILRSVGQKINTTINLVSGNPITVKELAELVQSLCPEIDILFKNNSSNESRFNFNNAKFDQYFPDFVFENRADLIEKLYDYKLKK
jgi:nucleoside-diphosphate-sugar epimerase